MNNQDIINEVRRKNDIVDVIGEKIPLEKRGKNYFGVCPFHDDTNPSMSVSREKQIKQSYPIQKYKQLFQSLKNICIFVASCFTYLHCEDANEKGIR